jgi:hypothetical protein
VFLEIDADDCETLEIQSLNIGRRWFKYYLKLRVLVEPVGIFAVAAVRWASAGLGVDDTVRLGSKDAEKSFRVHRSCADFHIIRLLKNAVMPRPVFFKL